MSAKPCSKAIVPLDLSGPKGKIVEASLMLFAASGYHAVSVRDIAREVGIKDASIYSHFSSKDEILETIIERFRAAFLANNPDVSMFDYVFSKVTPRGFLEKGFDLFKQRMDDLPTAWTYLVLMREKFDDGRAADAWNEHRVRVVRYVTDAFSAMIRLGLIPARDPESLARLYEYPILLLVEDYVKCRCRGEDGAEYETAIRAHVDFFADLATK